MFVSRFQKNLVILYQSGETQIWFLINVLGAFHHTVDCNYEHSVPLMKIKVVWMNLDFEMFHKILISENFSCLSHVEPKHLPGCPKPGARWSGPFNSSLKNGYFGALIFQKTLIFWPLYNFKTSWPPKKFNFQNFIWSNNHSYFECWR